MIPETILFLEIVVMGKPGEYVADSTEGITRVEDLPKPKTVRRSRNYKRRRCPQCARRAYRLRRVERTLHDLGDPISGRPRDLRVTYSQHRCPKCNVYFNADMDDLALPKCHYTHRVVALAVRLVVEDGLPYRAASWHLWRDHRVFVPFATIQNWVEAGGKKG
jgi:ribosomal protein S27AE